MQPLEGVPVLLVEDDPASCKLAFVLLRNAGAEVKTAESAEDALVVLTWFRPRVIVLDLVLPGLSGLDFVRLLRTAPATRGVAVVAVTASNGPAAERAALEAGCAQYVRKPIDIETFVATIAKWSQT